MKTEMNRITRLCHILHPALVRIVRSTVRYHSLLRRLKRPVLFLALLTAGLYSCNSGIQPLNGSGTSTEVVGHIVSPDNKAVKGVPVLLFDTLIKGTNSFVDTIADTTDEHGNFTLTVDYSGLYLLKVRDTIGRSYMDEVIVPIDNPSLSLGTLTVDTMGSIRGFIRDNTNFKANITVILYKKDMPFMYLWRRGAFTIDSLAPGDVRIQVGGWIDDYSRVNKWIIFYDSTIQVSPGGEVTIDTIFINDATLKKADEMMNSACDAFPSHTSILIKKPAYSSACGVFSLHNEHYPLLSRQHSPLGINKRASMTVLLFTRDNKAGAAGCSSEKNDIYVVSVQTAEPIRSFTGATYYAFI